MSRIARVVGLDPADPIKVSYDKAFAGEPTGISHRSGLKMDWSHGHNNAVINGIGRIGFMSGGKSALWVDEDMADTFTRKAVSFIEQQKGQTVLPLLRHARRSRTARAASAFRRQDFDGAEGRCIGGVRLVCR